MKYLKLFFLLFACALVLPSCDNSLPDSGEKDKGETDGNEFVDSDTIDYRALVFVEEGDLQSYGGERAFKNNLEKMFYNTTRFWNESPNKFKYYFRWVPAGVQTYKIDGERNKASYEKQRSATDNLDYSKYDFAVFFALGVKSGEGGLSCGGSSKGHKVVWAYIEEGHNIFTDAEYPNQGTYSNLGHEYGHVRGATDLYQYMIAAEDNPISHEKLFPGKCNMGTGFGEWSDYCSALFNYTAKMKQLDKNLGQNIFPKELVIKVKKNGKLAKNVKVSLYGTRAGGRYNKRDVYPEPYRVYATDRKGEVRLNNLYKLYHPDSNDPNIPPKTPKDLFPYSYWFSFIVEASDGNTKDFSWIPDIELQKYYLLTENDEYTVTLNL